MCVIRMQRARGMRHAPCKSSARPLRYVAAAVNRTKEERKKAPKPKCGDIRVGGFDESSRGGAGQAAAVYTREAASTVLPAHPRTQGREGYHDIYSGRVRRWGVERL